MKKYWIIILVIFPLHGLLPASGQGGGKGIIEGRIYNAKNNEPVPFANIVIWGTNIGSVGDLDGRFLFTGIEPGYVELRATSIGFKPYISEQVLVTNAKKVYIEIPMDETSVSIDEVVVKASPFRRDEESPVSLRRIGISEIENNPGGNRDISRVIQTFPGVASTPAFRNDVIVRGGGPGENRFYLDGVEIPNLNHFATQGASGGPVGIINVDFIREVDFYSGAFPANRGNALSSVLEMKQIDGNKDKLKFRGSVGASDLALTIDGPIGEKTTYIASVRRSYLQFLFSALGLPFLPTYNDFQLKVRTRLDKKNELTFIGLGAIDEFALNLEADDTPGQRYILSYIPVNEQWNYTVGGVYKHFRENSYDTWVLSRNYLNNIAYKYRNNIEEDSLKTLDYSSAEIENKFRYENTGRWDNGLKTNFGVNFGYAKYLNETFNRTFIDNREFIVDYDAFLEVFNWGLFGQVSRDFFKEKLTLSLGLRSDAIDYSTEMNNLLDQLSPRFSASYSITRNFFLNMNLGRYYQQPPYTTLGYKDNEGNFANRNNKITYITADHFVGGIEFLPGQNSKFTIEGFYKLYANYPLSLNDSITIASKGADFGTFGDEEVISEGEGRAYGMELLYRNKNFLESNLIVSYTLVRSEFDDFSGKILPSAWDNRHILNITATRKFKGNWEAGYKWRFVGGAPYTPYDLTTSSLKSAWDAFGRPVLDYSRFNSSRFGSFHQLDVRVDKQFYFNKWSLITYIDIQNLYNFKSDEPDKYIRAENENGVPKPATGMPPRYELTKITGEGQGTVLPTVGIIIEL